MDMINQIAAASEEQSATSEQISKNVQSISKVTSESASRIENVARSAEELSRLTNDLFSLMKRFKISAMNTGQNLLREDTSNLHYEDNQIDYNSDNGKQLMSANGDSIFDF
jgi:ABC-type transporter Mla subunit MlaD